jgi:hyperosmotically inducible protein
MLREQPHMHRSHPSYRYEVRARQFTHDMEIMKMSYIGSRRYLLFGSAAMLLGALAVAGCHNESAHPDEKSAITSSLNSNNLTSVSVSQDRDKGVITLTGDVTSDDQKLRAENLAKQAAPDYTIADQIGVRPVGDQSQASAVSSNLDSAIEHNFKASIKANKNLDDQTIHFKAKNGTLVLKGSVRTVAQKREAESLAKQVPNVQQVVNEIEVNPKKHSTANS